MNKRTVVISSEKLNRKGFRMLSAGAELDQYRKNPILLFMHNRPWRGTSDEVLPLGVVDNVRIEGNKVVGDLNFDMEDPFAAKIAAKWDKGIYKMVSPGVTPLEFSDAPEHLVTGQRYATLTRWRLDETSVVDIGANDDALSIKNTHTGKYITLSDDSADLGFIPEINLISNQSSIMKNIAIKLGLASDATEEQILAAISEKESRISTLQAETEGVRLSAITNAVDAAVREKRITEKQKDHFVQLGQKTDLQTLSATLSAIEPAVKPNDLITPGGKPPSGGTTDKKWEELSDADRIKLRDENPEAYKLAFEKEYGFAPKL